MELELIKLMCYGLGSVIILLFIYTTSLALLFLRHIRRNEQNKDFKR
jgi:hypothetical protein